MHMKKLFDQLDDKIVKLLSLISFIALIFVGIMIAIFLFRELYDMAILAFSTPTNKNYYMILQAILSFFIFFEFLTLIIISIRTKGHVSLLFLLTLGITALIRMLLTYHEELWGLLAISGSILMLIGGAILLKKFVFIEDSEEEHL